MPRPCETGGKPSGLRAEIRGTQVQRAEKYEDLQAWVGNADIAAAKQKVARDNAREDSEKPFPPTYQGREAPQLVPKKRLDLGTQPTEYNTDDLPTISGKAEKAPTAGAKRAKKQEKEVS